MRNNWMTLGIAAVVVSAMAITGNAVNITVADGVTPDTLWGASGSHGQGGEVNEVEANCLPGHEWDLESFDLTGRMLSLTAGYDFINGAVDPYGRGTYTTGDIYLKTGASGGDSYGYNYVFDLDVAHLTWNLYALTASSSDDSVYFGQNYNSNPWRFHPGNEPIVASGAITYTNSIDSLGFENCIGLLLPTMFDGESITFHYTYQCGNDVIKGIGTPVPDGGLTLALLGGVLVGIECIRRKMKR